MCKTDSWNDLILEGKNKLTVSWYHYHSISDEDCACSDTYEPTTATTLGFWLPTFPATSLNHKPRARKKLSIHLRQLLWCMVCLDALGWTNTASMFMNADLILSLNRWQIHVRYAKSWSPDPPSHHQTICWGSPTASSSENLLGHPPCSFGQSHFGEASGHQWSLECKVAEYPYLCHAWESTSLGHGQHLWRHQANTSSNWSLKNMTISAIEIESWPDLAVRSIEQWQGCLVAHPS